MTKRGGSWARPRGTGKGGEMRRRKFGGIGLALLASLLGCGGRSETATPPSGSLEDRQVRALLDRMTLEEKVGQMNQYIAPIYARSIDSPDFAKKLDDLLARGLVGSFLFVTDAEEANALQEKASRSRLGIPLIVGIDAVHGLAPVRGATIFPTPIGMAATFDDDLVERSAEITAREMRATGMHWAFYPVLDVARDPRWGRTAETFGEDPLVVASMGRATVRGLQGPDRSHLRTLACLKHFLGPGVPLGGRNMGPVDVSERTLRSMFLPPFQAGVEAGALSVMAAYNEVNGVPSHASGELLTRILRREWGFRGFVVSDWGAIEMLHTTHHVAASKKDAIRQAVLAGVDMHMQGEGFSEPLLELVRERAVPAWRIDEAAGRILRVKRALGLFEQRYVDASRASSVLAAPEHLTVALEAARKSIVLLRNEGGVLPLRKDLKKVLVTGPNAESTALLGDWTVPQPAENVITVLEGIRAAVSPATEVRFVDPGRVFEETNEALALAAEQARGADVAIVVLGENETRYDEAGVLDRPRRERTGGEGADRADLTLVGRQMELVRAIVETGTPTVVVLVNGRPLAIPWIAENVPAVLEAFEPGLVGGRAVAEVLFGDVSPSGRLPMSIPRSVGQLPVHFNHPPSAEGTYVDESSEPLYAFGHGLSYTRFAYSNLRVPERIRRGEAAWVSVVVQNAGAREADEVVLMFVRDVVSSVTRPVRQLGGFQRVRLSPGESRVVHFRIPFESLALHDRRMARVVEPGRFEVSIGGLSGSWILE
ncbi:glycoside hydrolase family 3 N-terminal domain-containing protein [Polyangium sp. 15x6]|uniref:glycoside hydrolase family 3 N-terminal domain-containing protein n=1 Tax=Polyangium sp. 15x6 TaxID=3042687 RepID=UPI00249C6E8F|nr:glycoside hydrolase family 3 N-terminal domain-containing protein [Polyangium sp. 15x6]MDI3283842.1 glycoside hydrolase family 3 N-terminal domain-containing protein [Polyangium sp. 15x6]